MTMPTPVWEFARESNNVFAGPLTLTVTADGSPVDPTAVRFAVVPSTIRPGDTDWAAPVDNPDTDTGGIGVSLPAVDQPGLFGWWAQITVAGAVEVLEPSVIAWIKRT